MKFNDVASKAEQRRSCPEIFRRTLRRLASGCSTVAMCTAGTSLWSRAATNRGTRVHVTERDALVLRSEVSGKIVWPGNK